MSSRFIKTLAFAGILIAIGCEVTDHRSDTPNFGDAYAITTGTTTPRLDVDGLHVHVQYSGGCKKHTFEVHYERQGDTTRLWLAHDGNNDACEAYLSETLTLDVTSRVLDTENVLLLSPDGASYRLR